MARPLSGTGSDVDTTGASSEGLTQAAGDDSGEEGGWGPFLRPLLPGLAVLVGFSLWGLTNREAWQDEALSVTATRELITTLDMTSGTMATYYVNLLAWIQVSDSLWWIRLLSVIHAAGALLVAGWLTLRQRGQTAALWSSLFLGTSYLMVRYAQEARSFVLAALVVSGAWLALDHVLADRGRRWIFVHVVLCALAPATHGLAVIAVLGQTVAVVLSGGGWRPLKRVAPGQAAALGVVMFLYLWGASDVGAGRPLTMSNAQDLLAETHGGPEVWERLDLVDFADLRVLLLALSLVGMAVGVQRAWRAAPGLERFRAITPTAWATAGIAGLFVLSVVHPSMLWRYAVPALPAVAMLQADAALAAQRWIGRRLPGKGTWRFAPVVPVLVLLLLASAQIPLHQPVSRPWGDTASVLQSRARLGDGFVAPQQSSRIPLDYEWSQRDGHLPVLATINPTHPLGQMKRFGAYQRWSWAIEELEALDRIWVLELTGKGRNPAVVRFLEFPEVSEEFEVAEVHTFSGVALTLMERSG